jgi:transcriptional regulator with XRE-family HTH domain
VLTLRSLRQQKGLSIKDVAERLGVQRQTVYQWERGETLPTLGKLVLLESIYGDDLIEAVRGTMKESGRWNKE